MKVMCSVLCRLVIGVICIEPVQAKTFTAALAETYDTNPEIDAARSALRAVDEQVPQALANWRPTVRATGSTNQEWVYSHPSTAGDQAIPTTFTGAGTTPNLPQASIPPGHETLQPYSYSVQVTQPLYRGGRTSADTERAENTVLAQRAALAQTEEETLLGAATAYLDVVRDQRIVQLQVDNTQILKRITNAFQDRLKAGEVSRTDVSQALAQEALTGSSRVRAENQLAASRASYVRYIGEMPDVLEQPKLTYIVPATLEEAEEEAARGNPQVLQANYTEMAAKSAVDLAEGAGMPELNLIGEAGRTREGYAGSPPVDDATVELQLSVPLYTGGLVSSQVRQAEQTAGQRRLQIAAARRLAEQQTIQAWNSLYAANASLGIQQEAVRAATDAYEGARLEDSVGTKTTLDLLNAVNVLLSTQTALVTTEHDQLVAEMTLLSATGRLTAQSLALPVNSYDPRDYYTHVHDKWGGTGIKAQYDALRQPEPTAKTINTPSVAVSLADSAQVQPLQIDPTSQAGPPLSADPIIEIH